MSIHRMPILLLLVATSATLAALPPDTADSFTSVADLNAIDRRSSRKGLPVYLDGSVQGLVFQGFVFKDATGRIPVHNNTAKSLCPGDHVRIVGHAGVDSLGDLTVIATNVTLLGHESPPPIVSTTLSEIGTGQFNLCPVKIEGVVTKAFRDEIDSNWNWFYVGNRHGHIAVALSGDASQKYLDALIDATVSVTGICKTQNLGYRRFISTFISVCNKSNIHIIKPASEDPFSAPLLNVTTDLTHLPQNEFIHRQRLSGHVVTAWQGNQLIMLTNDGYHLHVRLRNPQPLPSPGTPVTVVGFVCKDPFYIRLTEALLRIERGPRKMDKVSSCTAQQILFEGVGKNSMTPYFNGRTIRMKGIVRHTSTSTPETSHIGIDDGGHMVPVAIGNVSPPEIGSMVEVTGACLMDVESDEGGTKFGRLKGFSVILRTPDDLKVLTRPSWWTPLRLLVVIAILLASLFVIVFWNRVLHHLIERRSLALYKSEIALARAKLRISERTNLAMELHDTLAQNLTGISLQIAAAQTIQDTNHNAARRHIEAADRILRSCRTELRRCIWDLRSEVLDEKDFAEAIRHTLHPISESANVTVNVMVPRTRLNDSTAHAILCVLRELTANAINHGKAKHVHVDGAYEDGWLRISVHDDGCGFVPSERPGSNQGHFGIDGIKERIKCIGGSFTIESEPGQGACARIELKLPQQGNSNE